MAWIKILIIADSRGRRLERELQRVFEYVDFKLIWKSGLTLAATADFAHKTILHFRPYMIYIMTGICDITRVLSRDPWTVTLRSPTVQGTVNQFMYNLDTAHQSIYSLSKSVGHHIMIIIPTLTGLDIARYSTNYPNGLRSPQQVTLNQAIININRHITATNRSMQIYTPFLATTVHPRCRHHYRFVYAHLADGCHPTDALCARWADKLFANAMRNVDKYHSFNLTNAMYYHL